MSKSLPGEEKKPPDSFVRVTISISPTLYQALVEKRNKDGKHNWSAVAAKALAEAAGIPHELSLEERVAALEAKVFPAKVFPTHCPCGDPYHEGEMVCRRCGLGDFRRSGSPK
jgi:hypothetical protein